MLAEMEKEMLYNIIHTKGTKRLLGLNWQQDY